MRCIWRLKKEDRRRVHHGRDLPGNAAFTVARAVLLLRACLRLPLAFLRLLAISAGTDIAANIGAGMRSLTHGHADDRTKDDPPLHMGKLTLLRMNRK